MLAEVLAPVADFIEEKRLSGGATGATDLLRKANIPVDFRDKTEWFHWSWLRPGMNPAITVWAEWIEVVQGDRWMTVEHIDVDHRIGGQPWLPIEVPRAERRFRILRDAERTKMPLLGFVQTNRLSIDQLLAGNVSEVSVRVRHDLPWHVVAVDDQTKRAVLVRGLDAWKPTGAQIESALNRWAVRRSSPPPVLSPPQQKIEPIVFVNIAWMKRYQGHSENDPVMGRNFGYFAAEGHPMEDAHEQWNFTDTNGQVYGYVPRSSPIDISRLGALNGQTSIEGVLVVFIARDPAEDCLKVVGWYASATVHRNEVYTHDRGALTVRSAITAATARAVVVPVADRRIVIPTAQREPGGVGQSPLWYGEGHPAKLTEVREYVAKLGLSDDGGLAAGRPGGGGRGRPRQPDIETRLAVEKASMAMALSYFDGAQDVSKYCRGWDIEALDSSGEIYIEVKGLSGPDVNVELTPNEYAKMQEFQDKYVLYVVTSALTQKPRARVFRWGECDGIPAWRASQGDVLELEAVVGARGRVTA